MKPEQQRIAIAEACGIAGPFDNRWVREYEKEGGDAHGLTGFEKDELVFIPDYLNDLNAMNEAEQVLVEKQWPRYNTEVSKQCPNSWMVHATAAQRAEAFLRTLGKWEEVK